jgi:hypothetical protein
MECPWRFDQQPSGSLACEYRGVTEESQRASADESQLRARRDVLPQCLQDGLDLSVVHRPPDLDPPRGARGYPTD